MHKRCELNVTNMSAIKDFGVTINNSSFNVQDDQTFIIYDPLQLFKSTRNNFINRYFKYTVDTDSILTYEILTGVENKLILLDEIGAEKYSAKSLNSDQIVLSNCVVLSVFVILI